MAAKRSAKPIKAADKPAYPSGPRLIGYARVSTEDQNLDLQIEALRRAGVHPDNIHTEHVSGVSERRIGLDTAMMDARAGDTLLVWKLDRFGRSMNDIYDRLRKLEDNGVGFKSITDSFDTTSAMGRMALGVLAVFAQFERDLISERTKAGMQRAYARGVRPGRQPVLSEADIAKGVDMMLAGKSRAEVAAALGCHPMTVKRWISPKIEK